MEAREIGSSPTIELSVVRLVDVVRSDGTIPASADEESFVRVVDAGDAPYHDFYRALRELDAELEARAIGKVEHKRALKLEWKRLLLRVA